MAKRKEGEILPAYILWTYSSNAGGLHPVKIRITHQRKREYYPVFLPDREKLFLSQADFLRITSTPLSKLRGEFRAIRQVMDIAVQSAKSAIEEATIKGKTPFSFGQFERIFLGAESGQNFLSYFKSHIEKYGKKGQAGTVRTYASAYSALREFLNGKDIDPADISVKKLSEFDEWLREPHVVIRDGKKFTISPKNDTSVSIYMRCIRCVYNEMAVGDDYLTSIYPFSRSPKDQKYKIPSSSGQKGQTMTREDLAAFVRGRVSGERIPENPMYRAKQLFLFSFFGQGINFKDMAMLKYDSIKRDSIEFDRQKTIRTRKEGRKVRVPLSDELRDILMEQGNPERKKENYVFEVFDSRSTISPKEMDDRIRQWIKNTNKWLKLYCKFNGIEEVSTYASRHTFASLAKSYLPVAMISQMLGHSRITTTQAYLGRFENEENRVGLMKVFKGLS